MADARARGEVEGRAEGVRRSDDLYGDGEGPVGPHWRL